MARMHSLPLPSVRACLQAPPPPAGLGWDPLDLQGADINALVRGCAGVDQQVPPVPHIDGGTREGNARWEAFRRNGLDQYASRRNNAMLRCGLKSYPCPHERPPWCCPPLLGLVMSSSKYGL